MRIVQNKSANLYFEVYDTVREFAQHIERATVCSKFESRQASQNEDDGSWYGTRTFAEAQELMTHGYRKGAENLAKVDSSFKVANNTPQPRWKRDVCGARPIVARAVMGLPDAMMRRMVQPTKSRVVNIIYCVSTSCGMSAAQMERGGRVMMALVKGLESKGVRVNLTAMELSSGKDKLAGVSVKIKDAKSNLNPMLAAYFVACPSFLRRHIFRWMEVTPACNTSGFCSGYGQPVTAYMNNKDAKQYLVDLGLLHKDDCYVHIMDAIRCNDVNKLIAQLGVK